MDRFRDAVGGTERSAVLLLAANLVPAYGVLFLGWSAFQVMLLYWMETVVIGFYTIARVMAVEEGLLNRLFTAGFLTFNSGGFMYVHLIVLVAIADNFAVDGALSNASSVIGAAMAVFPGATTGLVWMGVMFAVHGYSFARWFHDGGVENAGFKELTRAMDRRLFYMHFFLLGAFLLVLFAGPSTMALELFVVVTKAGADLLLER